MKTPTPHTSCISSSLSHGNVVQLNTAAFVFQPSVVQVSALQTVVDSVDAVLSPCVWRRQYTGKASRSYTAHLTHSVVFVFTEDRHLSHNAGMASHLGLEKRLTSVSQVLCCCFLVIPFVLLLTCLLGPQTKIL